MSHDAHVLDLLPAYVLGSLDAEEASRVEQHLLSCFLCRSESDSFEAVTGQLSLAAPVRVSPPDLKDRLMQRIQTIPARERIPVAAAKRPWLERFLPVWSLASLCLIVAFAGLNVFLWQRLARTGSPASRTGMHAVPLNSTDSTSKATGFVLISQDGDSGTLVVDGLPPLADSQQYQVWLTRDGQRISGALFSTDEKDYGTTRIRAPRSLLEYSAVDVTIEPAGGSPQPTGVKVLGGPLLNP
jgi:anti-sigma-K factor RskA